MTDHGFTTVHGDGGLIIGGDILRGHIAVIGTSTRGRSRLLEQQAESLGISYDELLKKLEPTDEQKERMMVEQDRRKQADANRLKAVAEAYWAATSPDDSELDVLHDALLEVEGLESPSREQQRALFVMLPATIVGSGISWGFSDTEVRENIYAFVVENLDAVSERVRAAQETGRPA